jgi:NADPH:quinone reductase-like Zn-dependent oxidoreductase
MEFKENRMERLEYCAYGGPEVVHLSPFTLPDPTGDQILVRVAASSINPMDWKLRNGIMKMTTGNRFPRAMGTDFSGTVECVGSGALNIRVGDSVMGTTSMKASGAFAPMLITSEKLVVKKPDNLTFAQAASLPIAAVTSWLALVKTAHLKRGQRLLINGATGGVGLAAGEIARAIGAQVAGRAGPSSIAQAKAHGIDALLDYTQPLPESLNRTFDVVFDCSGTLTPKEAKQLIKRGGTVVDIVPTPGKFIRSVFSSWYKVLIADPKAENLQAVADLAASGQLNIPIARTLALAEAPTLLRSLERGERLFGKAIIAF